MIDADEDNIALSCEILSVVTILFYAVAAGITAAVEPYDDGLTVA